MPDQHRKLDECRKGLALHLEEFLYRLKRDVAGGAKAEDTEKLLAVCRKLLRLAQ